MVLVVKQCLIQFSFLSTGFPAEGSPVDEVVLIFGIIQSVLRRGFFNEQCGVVCQVQLVPWMGSQSNVILRFRSRCSPLKGSPLSKGQMDWVWFKRFPVMGISSERSMGIDWSLVNSCSTAHNLSTIYALERTVPLAWYIVRPSLSVLILTEDSYFAFSLDLDRNFVLRFQSWTWPKIRRFQSRSWPKFRPSLSVLNLTENSYFYLVSLAVGLIFGNRAPLLVRHVIH